jgi:Outer membrane protein beta-barrel domain
MSIRVLALLGLLTGVCDLRLQAQEESKLNTSLGVGVSVPVNPTGRLAGVSVNTVVGAGYNFDKHHSLIGEFMYSNLPPSGDAIRPISLVTQVKGLSGSGSLFTLTGNYRFTVERKVVGAYVIGGGGLYYRLAELSKPIVVGTGTVCSPSWQWWGYTCVAGNVSQDETLVSSGSAAFGGNAGVGLTFRVSEEGYKVFVESRYHYAPNKNIATQLITITIGIRWW